MGEIVEKDVQDEVKFEETINLTVSQDNMKAFVSFTQLDNGRMPTIVEMLDYLNRNGIIYGLNMTNIEDMVKYPVYSVMNCVAEGTAPVNGQNGMVEFHFEVKKAGKPTILEDGSVDFKELNMIESVVQGQKLCTVIPPYPGVPGKTVYGTVATALIGKAATLPKGRNVSISEDGMTLVADINGQVSYLDGKVSVFSTYEVPADVDNTTGNISFVGNVSIRGNVLSGFSVEAGGTVEVWGVVEGAFIKAGGDIILRRGIQGMGKGVIMCDGDIIARYIENSTVTAKNDIKSEVIMHSNVKCGNKLELAGRKGLLVGGICKVGKEVIAKVIGSHMATVTDIEVGVDPSLRERYKSVKESINSIETDIKKADQAIALLKKLEMAGTLSPDKQEILVKSVRTKVHFSNKLSELKEEISVIESKLQQESFGKVRCLNLIYPGTKVTIGSCLMYVRENLQYCTLYKDGAEIRVGAIDR